MESSCQKNFRCLRLIVRMTLIALQVKAKVVWQSEEIFRGKVGPFDSNIEGGTGQPSFYMAGQDSVDQLFLFPGLVWSEKGGSDH